MGLRGRPVVLACVAAATAGCATSSAPLDVGGRQEKLDETYPSRVQAAQERLEALFRRVGDPSRVLLAGETVESLRQAARMFAETVEEYGNLVLDHGRGWTGANVSALEAALSQAEEVESRLRALELQISLLDDAARTRYEELKLQAAQPGPALDLGPTQEFIATTGQLTSLAGAVTEYLSYRHGGELQKLSRRTKTEAAGAVFHFLRLAEVEPRSATSHAATFQAAWRGWMRAELRENRVKESLDLYATVIREAEDYWPESAQDLVRVTHAVLRRHPDGPAAEEIERSLAQVESVYGSGPSGPRAWRGAVEEVRGALLLCRARRSKDAAEGIELALRAIELAPLIAREAPDHLALAAREISETHVAAGKYADAVDAFQRILTSGSSSEAATMVGERRAEVFQQALVDLQYELETARFESARNILSEAFRLSEGDRERTQVSDALGSYYERYVDSLLSKNDVDGAVSVCSEALRTFPSSAELRMRLDKAHLLLLEQELGNLSTTDERLGGARVRALLMEKSRKMLTSDGTSACERVLDHIEEIWSRKAAEATNPDEAYRIGVEIGVLRGLSDQQQLEAGADALWSFFEKAREAQDWSRLERSIDVCFSRCAGVARPETFKNGFLEFLDELEKEEDHRKLYRYASIFAAAYPQESARVMQLVAKHVDAGELSDEFSALLASMERGDVVSVLGPSSDAADDTGSAATADRRPGASPLVDPDQWWREPPPPDDLSTVEDAQLLASEKRRKVVLSTAAGGVITSVGILLFLFVMARRGRLLRFRWYAGAAMWIAITAGFIGGVVAGGGLDTPTPAETEAGEGTE